MDAGKAVQDFRALLQVFLAWVRKSPYQSYKIGQKQTKDVEVFKSGKVPSLMDDVVSASAAADVPPTVREKIAEVSRQYKVGQVKKRTRSTLAKPPNCLTRRDHLCPVRVGHSSGRAHLANAISSSCCSRLAASRGSPGNKISLRSVPRRVGRHAAALRSRRLKLAIEIAESPYSSPSFFLSSAFSLRRRSASRLFSRLFSSSSVTRSLRSLLSDTGPATFFQ